MSDFPGPETSDVAHPTIDHNVGSQPTSTWRPPTSERIKNAMQGDLPETNPTPEPPVTPPPATKTP